MAGKCAEKVASGPGPRCKSPDRCCFEADTPGVIRAAAQYGVAQRIVDLCTFDVTRHPWRCGGLFDAIITDPPCTFPLPHGISQSLMHDTDGVRAGAKRLGRKKIRDDRPPPQVPRP